MTDTTPFTDLVITGLNNPECAFYTGAFVGQWLALKYLVIIAIMLAVFKTLDKLALEPLLKYVKSKTWGRKK